MKPLYKAGASEAYYNCSRTYKVRAHDVIIMALVKKRQCSGTGKFAELAEAMFATSNKLVSNCIDVKLVYLLSVAV